MPRSSMQKLVPGSARKNLKSVASAAPGNGGAILRVRASSDQRSLWHKITKGLNIYFIPNTKKSSSRSRVWMGCIRWSDCLGLFEKSLSCIGRPIKRLKIEFVVNHSSLWAASQHIHENKLPVLLEGARDACPRGKGLMPPAALPGAKLLIRREAPCGKVFGPPFYKKVGGCFNYLF